MRVVLINYDGAGITLRCLEALENLTYPRDRYEIVLVDNGSIDGVVWTVRRRFPQVRIIESLSNEGFARGNNLAFQDLDGVDFVALINNDAIADADWLTELVRPMTIDAAIGITTSKMLFNRNVVGLMLESNMAPVSLSGLRLDGAESSGSITFDERWRSEIPGTEPSVGDRSRFHRWIPRVGSFAVSADDVKFPAKLEVRLAASQPTEVLVRGHNVNRTVVVNREPGWFEFEIESPGYLVNNAGGGLFPGFHGGDVGFKELDTGQFDEPRDVFSFCGGAAALRVSLLRDLGGFDPTFFLYYEDFDLSWRAHFRGWRIRYVPSAIVLHEHAYSSGEWSPFFRFWVDRNRRLTLIKNAPFKIAAKTFCGAVIWGLRDVMMPGLRSLRRLEKPPLAAMRNRGRQLGSFLKACPPAVRFRRQQLRKSEIDVDFVYDWMTTR